MKIFVTGGTGFVGTKVVRALTAAGHHVRCLTRDNRDLQDAESVRGDILDPDSLQPTMAGCDAVIHLVGIIDERPAEGITFERVYVDGTRNVVEASKNAGISRFVYMSANGARPDGVSSYQTGKWKAEEIVRAAGFESVTIFRPSLIFGQPEKGRREFASDLVDQMIKPFPILPIFGDGSFRMQPVFVGSVAKAFAMAATDSITGLREYGVSGPGALTYVEMIDIITEASGRRRKPKIHIPVPLVRLGIDLMGWTGLLPISGDQLEMLVEGNSCPHEPFHKDFEIEPVPFSTDSLDYLMRPIK